MIFKVIDRKTGKEPSSKVIEKLARYNGLMEMDIDGFYIGEDGSLLLADDCGRAAQINTDRLTVVFESQDTARWEYVQYDGNSSIGNWHCSKCRNIVKDMPTCMLKPIYDYCPYCGRRIESDDKE